MKKVLITGSAGLIGSEAVKFFADKGFEIYGIDNNMRAYFFGQEASTIWNRKRLEEKYIQYHHNNLDIRDQDAVEQIFKRNKFDLIIHTAAQPSHDWAAKEPYTDFSVNANGTLILLENMRKYSPDAVFIFTSTNKVYGDTPNTLPLIELDTRWELPKSHKYYRGIDESMSLDDSKHSIFGASKVAADIMVQEYGKYFNLKTAVFRGGCLTGPAHSGTKLHGFLAYLIRCVATGRKYSIYGYKSKQVRDNIHSFDLVNAFYHFYLHPRQGEAYNMGGSRHANISMLEAIQKTERILNRKINLEYVDKPRQGDHIWYISDVSKFQNHYPNWHYEYDIDRIIDEICTLGHFAAESKGSSTLTIFEGETIKKNKLDSAMLFSHVTDAFGPAQALKRYIASQTSYSAVTEHSLEKTTRKPLTVFGDIAMNISWYRRQNSIHMLFAINPINALSASILKLMGKKFTYIYYTLDYSSYRFSNPVLNIAYHLIDRASLKLADYVWSTSPEVQQIRSKMGVIDKKNILVRNGIKQIGRVQSAEKKSSKLRAKLLIDGFFSKTSTITLAIESLAKLKKAFPQISLTIILGHANKSKILSVIKRHRLSQFIHLVENVTHDRFFDEYTDFGIGLGLFDETPYSPAYFKDPSEIKEFLAAGLPVICSQGITLSQEIESEKMGLVVKNSVISISEAIFQLLTNKKMYSAYSRNALHYASQVVWDSIFNNALNIILKGENSQ